MKTPKNITGRDRTRYLVRKRDNFTCLDCGKKWNDGRHFDVHHISGLCGKKSRSYDKVSEMDGLITLCHKCHYNRPEHRCKSIEYREKSISNYYGDPMKIEAYLLRNYTIFYLAKNKKMKSVDIAKKYGMTKQRVSQIVLSTHYRLHDSVEAV